MKVHRIRLAKSIDDNPNDMIFVELFEDTWLEANIIPRSHNQIHNWINREFVNKNGIESGPLTYDTRAFKTGIIKDWRETDPIE